MIALDYTVVVQIIAFLILWYLLTRLLFRPFLDLLEERERRTEGVKAEADSFMAEAERLRAEYENRIGRARDEASALKEKIYQEALKTRENLLAQAREEAAQHFQRVREEIQKELEGGQELAAREGGVIAQQMAEKILARKVG